MIIIPKGSSTKKHKNNTDIEEDPRGFHKQTTLIQCFSGTKAHSIKAPNNILVKHLVNGLFGTLTTSCSSGPFRLSADTTGTLSENERLSKTGAAGEHRGLPESLKKQQHCSYYRMSQNMLN